MVEEYRGITLMPTLYKLYVVIRLAERMNSEMEEKGIVPIRQVSRMDITMDIL